LKKNDCVRKCHLRVGDSVLVLCGKDKGKRGKVLALSHRESKAIVSGVMVVSKHVKSKKVDGESGIFKTESAIYSCKLKVVCNNCDCGTRVKYVLNDGKKKRVCKKCDGEISVNRDIKKKKKHRGLNV